MVVSVAPSRGYPMTAMDDRRDATGEGDRQEIPDEEDSQEITDDDVRVVIEDFIGHDNSDAESYVRLEVTENGDIMHEFKDEFMVDYSDRDLWVDEECKILTDGSTAIVINCFESLDDYRRNYALKIPRPSVLKGDEEEESWEQIELEEQRNEAMKQGRLSHPNVTYLIDTSDVHLPVEPEPRGTVMLQEWIEGAEPMDDYVYPSDEAMEALSDVDLEAISDADIEELSDAVVELEHLVELFIQVFRGLHHIHEKKLVHWDVKPGNCLVGDSEIVKISDVGNARERAEDQGRYGERTYRYTSKECLPSEANVIFEEVEGSNRILGPLVEGDLNLDKRWLDLYMAGRMMAKICGLECGQELEDDYDKAKKKKREVFRNHVFDSSEPNAEMTDRYLNIIAARLLKPFDSIDFDSEDGIDGDPDPYYENGDQVATDLEKLLHEFGGSTDIPELYPVPQESLRTPVTGGTEFSARIENLTNTTPARRLREHKQLGLARFAYPGARHSRFEHILGTVGTTLEYIRALYSDRTNPAFRLLCDSTDVRALIFAAGVHDMGHGAFSHYLEEMIPMFHYCTHQDYMQAVLRNDPDKYDENASSQLSGHLAVDRKELEDIVAEDWIKSRPPDDPGVDEFLELVADILWPTEMNDPEWNSDEDFVPDLRDRKQSKEAKIWILHSIIESAFDADKLDYLRRDAEHAGLDYPKGADVERFLQSLTVTTRPPSKQSRSTQRIEEFNSFQEFRPTIAVNQNGINSLESLILARYQIHKTLYWHRSVRSAAALLNNQVWRYLMECSSRTRLSSNNSYNRRSFKECRSELLENFRVMDDESAIRWLLHEKRMNQDHDEDIKRYSDCLLACEGLPKPIIDVRQGEISDENEDVITQIVDNHQKLIESNWNDYMDEKGEIIQRTGEKLEDDLGDYELDEEVDLGQGTLFVDVPVPSEDHPIASKEQIKNLFVVDSHLLLPNGTSPSDGSTQEPEERTTNPNPLGPSHEIREFGEVSALNEDTKDNVGHWSRPIRVFVWEEDREKMLDAVDHDQKELANKVIKSLEKAYEEAVGE